MRAPRLCSQRTSKWGGLPNTGRNTSRILTRLLALGAASFGAPALAHAESSAIHERPAQFVAHMEQQSEWEDVLLWYLIWLYETLGGDPATLQNTPPVQCMDRVSDLYTKAGMTPGLTESERSAFREIVEDLWNHLDGAPPDFNTLTLARFYENLRRMYSDVGGNPDTLL